MNLKQKAANGWEHLIAPSIIAPKLNAARLVTPCANAIAAAAPVSRMTPRSKTFASRARHAVLFARPGLFADGFARSLRSLGAWLDVKIIPCDQINATPRLVCDLAIIDAEGVADLAAVIADLRMASVGAAAVITASDDDCAAARALSLGAMTVISKTLGETQVLDALRRLLDSNQIVGIQPRGQMEDNHGHAVMQQGNPYRLTPGELDVLRLLAEGMTNQQIAEHRGSKEGTVKIHLDKIYKKLQVQNRTQAMGIAVRMEAIRDLQLREIERGGFRFEALIPYVTHELRREGDILFRRGDRSDCLYYIRRGKIHLPELDLDLEDGGLLGEIGIFSPGHSRTCTAVCRTQASLFRLTAEQAERLYIENPRFAYHVVKLIAARLIADRTRQDYPQH